MSRTRSLANLRDDARKRADVEALDDRHPDPDVTRYINQGGAALRDLLIKARGRTYFRKATPQTITTTSATQYALNSDFLRLISVRLSGVGGYTLEPFTPQDEPWLREPGVSGTWPTHYELQPGYIELLPASSAGQAVIVDYIPTFADLVADDDTLEGYAGWEEYVVCFAACCMLTKDGELEDKSSIRADMKDIEARIASLAPGRDAFRAERVKDVRHGSSYLYGRYRGGW